MWFLAAVWCFGLFGCVADVSQDEREVQDERELLISLDDTSRRVGSLLEASATVAADFDGNGQPEIAACGLEGVVMYTRVKPDAAARAATADVLGAGLAPNVPAYVRRDGTAGNESWTRTLIYAAAAGEGFDKLVLADVDGDGLMDVLSGGLQNEAVTWHHTHEASGALALGGEVLLATGAGVSDFFVFDVDGDGDVDVLVANFYESTLGWYENSAGWAFHQISDSFPTLGPSAIAFGDVDGDGKIDVLCAATDDEFLSWFSMDDPTKPRSTQWSWHAISADVSGPSSLIVADFDGDGDADVVCAEQLSNKIRLFLNEDGKGQKWVAITVDGDATAVHELAAADVDGDGDVDFFASIYAKDEIGWYENVGSGRAWSRTAISNGLTGGPMGLFLTDMDEDGDIDLVSTGFIAGDRVDLGRVAWHDLHLVPAPTAAPTVSPGPTGAPSFLPTATSHPASTLESHIHDTPSFIPTTFGNNRTFTPTLAPASFPPNAAPTPAPSPSPTEKFVRDRKAWHEKYRIHILAGFGCVLGILIFAFLRGYCCKPLLRYTEPWWLPKYEYLQREWGRSVWRRRICIFCPKRCKGAILDPLEPADGVEIKPGGYFPVRVVTETQRPEFKFRVRQTGTREITLY